MACYRYERKQDDEDTTKSLVNWGNTTLTSACKWVIGKCDTDIGAAHKQAIVTVVERKSGYAVMAKVSNKTADLVGAAIIEALNRLKARVKTLTYDNGKEFSGHARIDEALGSTG